MHIGIRSPKQCVFGPSLKADNLSVTIHETQDFGYATNQFSFFFIDPGNDPLKNSITPFGRTWIPLERTDYLRTDVISEKCSGNATEYSS